MLQSRLYHGMRSSRVGEAAVTVEDNANSPGFLHLLHLHHHLHLLLILPQALRRRLQTLRLKRAFLPFLLAGVALGIGLGCLLRLRPDPYSPQELAYLRLPADVLGNLLHVLILPLVMTSIVTGPTQLDTPTLRRLGLMVGVLYVAMTILAAVLGTVLANVANHCKPGDMALVNEDPLHGENFVDLFLDLIRNMLPDNLVDMTFQKIRTVLKEKKVSSPSSAHENTTNATDFSANKTEYHPEISRVKGVNLLGVITISYIAGILITRLGSMTLTLKVFFEAIYDVTQMLISIVAWYIPFGVVFLLMEETATEREQVFRQWLYLLTVLFSLAVYGFLLLPAIYYCVSGRNPYLAVRGVLPALVIAFATSSNVLALPFTMQNLERNNQLNPYVVMTLAPLGAALNLPAKALFGPIAAAFVGCMNNVFTHLHSGSLLLIGLAAILTAVVTEGHARADVVTTSLLLTTIDVPSDRTGFILPPEWILGRFRAVVSVLNDTYGAGIVHHLSTRLLTSFQLRSQEQGNVTSVETSVTSARLSAGQSAVLSVAVPVPMTIIREETEVAVCGQAHLTVNNSMAKILQDISGTTLTTEASLTGKKSEASSTAVVDTSAAAAAAAADNDGDDNNGGDDDDGGKDDDGDAKGGDDGDDKKR